MSPQCQRKKAKKRLVEEVIATLQSLNLKMARNVNISCVSIVTCTVYNWIFHVYSTKTCLVYNLILHDYSTPKNMHLYDRIFIIIQPKHVFHTCNWICHHYSLNLSTEFLRKKEAVLILQDNFRSFRLRLTYLRKRRATIVLQVKTDLCQCYIFFFFFFYSWTDV